MNLLPLIPRFNSNLSSERCLGYHSFENANCKYSNYDKVNEFSRLSNSSYQLSNYDKYEAIRDSKCYEDNRMQVVIEHNKFHEAGRMLNDSTKDGREFNSMGLMKATQNNVRSNMKPLRKRNCDDLSDELNIKKLHQDDVKSNEISKKGFFGSSKENLNVDKNHYMFDDDDLADYFIGTEAICNKSYEKPIFIDSCVPIKLSEEDIRKEQENLSYQYAVFDYKHKDVDVEKLAIVDPNFNSKKDEEYCSTQSSLIQSCSETPKKLKCGLDEVVSDKASVGVVTSPELSKQNDMVQKTDNKQWKLIRIDCPLRVQITRTEVNLKNCSARDPRLNHLRS